MFDWLFGKKKKSAIRGIENGVIFDEAREKILDGKHKMARFIWPIGTFIAFENSRFVLYKKNLPAETDWTPTMSDWVGCDWIVFL